VTGKKGSGKRKAALTGGLKWVNREASNRVAGHSRSRRLDDLSYEEKSLRDG
jgi:hypothetical protein